jgi:hypothetical protein
MMPFFDLRANLLTEILTQWVSIDSLLVLDSANCNKKHRAGYLKLLRSKEFCISKLPSSRAIPTRGIDWFVIRNVRIKEVIIDGGLIEEQESVKHFLPVISPRVEKLRSVGLDIAELCPADTTFPRLHSLTIEADRKEGLMLDGERLEELLASCRALKRLRLKSCDLRNSFASDLALADLQMLHIADCGIDSGTMCTLLSASPSLRSFYTDAQNDGDACLDELAAHCPLLQVLAHGLSSVAVLENVLVACPLIEVVEFTSSASDELLLSVLQHCKRLRALCWRGGSGEMSDACAQALQVRMPDLTHLSLLEWEVESEEFVLDLASQSSNLRSLTLSVSDVSPEALTELIRNLTNVTELNFVNVWHGDAVLESIAKHCPKLEVLHLCCMEGYTENGILAVAQACTALRQLSVRQGDGVLTSTVLGFWQLLRPELQAVVVDTEYIPAGQYIPAGHGAIGFWAFLQGIEKEDVVVW